MKANEYYKQMGWNFANIKIAEMEHAKQFDDFYHDLKRIIESHDLVRPYIGSDDGQWFFIADYCKKNRISPFDSENYEKAKRIYLGAIADVESCQ